MSFKMNEIVVGDCIELMKELDSECVDLCFGDPPFNIGYEYDQYDDRKTPQEYLDWTSEWLGQVRRALKLCGSFWLAIGDEYVSELDVLCKAKGFFKRSHVVWYYTFGVNCTHNFTRSHTHLLYYTKDRDRFTFNKDDKENRIPSARQLVYNDKRANSKGRLPDNTWILRPQEIEDCLMAEQDTWHVPRVNGSFRERQGWHNCQMPTKILERIVGFSSNPGELVLDPFSGSGTTGAVCKVMGRNFITCDLSQEYVTKGNERISDVQDQGLCDLSQT